MPEKESIDQCVKLRESKDFVKAAKCFEQHGRFEEAFNCDMEAIKTLPETDFQKMIEIIATNRTVLFVNRNTYVKNSTRPLIMLLLGCSKGLIDIQ